MLRRDFIRAMLVSCYGATPIAVAQSERFFFIAGHVERPGKYRFIEHMTVMQAIATAGVITPEGSMSDLSVKRLVDGKVRQVVVKPPDPVLPEDTVLVGRRN